MKKSIATSLVVVPLALGSAYIGSAWFIGKQVEASIGENYQLLADHPFVKVAQRDYQRRLFSATETVTLEFLSETTQATERRRQEMMAANPGVNIPPIPAMTLSFRSEIRHGPLLGFSKLGAALVDTELVLEGPLQQAATNLFGSNKPLLAHSEYRFDGGGLTTLTSPGFSTRWPASQGAGMETLNWEGISATIDFQKGMKQYSVQAGAPKLEIRDSRSGGLLVSDLKFESKQQRMFDDDPLLYTGSAKLSLAQVSFNPGREGAEAVSLKQFAYSADIPLNGDFIDIIAKVSAETLAVGAQNYGPAHYDVSLRHLHARTVTSLFRTMLKLQSDPALQAEARSNPQALMTPLAQPATALLNHNPEIVIDRISFRSPEGEAMLSARVKLKDFKEEDLSNPPALLTKLDASAEIAVPEAIVSFLTASPAAQKVNAKDPEAAPEDPAVSQMKMLRKLEALTEQGLILREGTLIKSKLSFSDGNLSFNGKPFDPKLLEDPEPPKVEPNPIDHPAMRPVETPPAKSRR